MFLVGRPFGLEFGSVADSLSGQLDRAGIAVLPGKLSELDRIDGDMRSLAYLVERRILLRDEARPAAYRIIDSIVAITGLNKAPEMWWRS